MILYCFIPLLTGIWNRWARGEGNMPRLVWYVSMVTLAIALGYPSRIELAYCWALFLLGYALAPWHAMFNAITGAPPGRQDGALWNWMQKLAYRLTPHLTPFSTYWQMFGIIYGTIRASLMLPGIASLCRYYQSPVPLIGLALLGMGLVYYAAGKVAEHFRSPNIPVPVAEFIMGYFIGCYFIVCGGL